MWFHITFTMKDGSRPECRLNFPNLEAAYTSITNSIGAGGCIVSVGNQDALVINAREITSTLIVEN